MSIYPFSVGEFTDAEMLSTSTKAQLVNPRKIYSVDTSLVQVISSTTTMDAGKKLENLIYLHLRKT